MSNVNRNCGSCGISDIDCWQGKTHDGKNHNGACCGSCHINVRHGQSQPGYVPPYEAAKEYHNMITDIKNPTKQDYKLAYRAAQAKLDGILDIVRRFGDEMGYDFCEDGVKDFCEETGIKYVPPVVEAGFTFTVTFSRSEVQLDDQGGVSDQALSEALDLIEKTLATAGIGANVNPEDSWAE